MTNPRFEKLSGGQIAVLGFLVGMFVVVAVWLVHAWTATSNVAMDKNGWIALSLGAFFSLVIGCGLMALMFFSSRSGYDERANPDLRDRHKNRE